MAVALWLAASGLAAACGGSGSPASPTPPPVSETLTCPADIGIASLDGAPVAVTYPAPVAAPTQAPVSCLPASGSAFPVGTTRVACSATINSQTAACTFNVRVTANASPQTSKTRILAFGDSITKGYLSTGPLMLGPAGDPVSYPYKLRVLLQDRYQAQTIYMFNEGRNGETSAGGRNRLPDVLTVDQPDLMLLIEGNSNITLVSPDSIKADLKAMVQLAQGLGIAVRIATLTPVADTKEMAFPGTQAAILAVNSRIVQLAQEQHIAPAVDLFAAFGTDRSLLGFDGEHPTDAGYTVMAQTFFPRLVHDFEKQATLSPLFRALRRPRPR